VKTHRTSIGKFVSLAAIAAGAVVLILMCANPVDQPPLKWLSRIEVPITNDSFHLARKLPDLMSNFNDTIVKFWYRVDSLPWYRSTDIAPVRPSNHARYFATKTVTYTYASEIWEQNHVYEWLQKSGVWQWDDLGEVIDILKGGYDSANTGIYYTGDPEDLLLETVRGDTVVMSIPRVDSISYAVKQDSIKDKYYHPTFGLITISNAPLIIDTLPPAGSPPLPAGPFPPTAFNLSLHGVDVIIFDTSSPAMPITVRNLTGATINNIDITIFDSVRSTSLGPYGSAVLSFPVVGYDAGLGHQAGKGITGGVLGVQVRYNNADDTARIALEMNCNGLVASEVTVQDSLLSFSKTFINDYDLTDTLDVKYIDVQYGFFRYYLTNYTQLELKVMAEQMHLWITPACEQKGVDSIPDIAAAFPTYDDSFVRNYYLGMLTTAGAEPHILPDSTFRIITQNLSGTRLFPLWNPSLGVSGKSVSRVKYTISNVTPHGNMVNVKSTDSLLFVIQSPYFHFKEMTAVVTQEYRRGGDTAKVEMPFPFSSESKQSLRNNFRLKQVLADIFFVPRLPDSQLPQQPRMAFLEHLGIEYKLFTPDDPYTGRVDTSTTFDSVINKKRFRLQSNITGIMNQWPDSMYITEQITVPVGTHILAVNEQASTDPDYDLYMGRMNIGALTNVRTNMLFGWSVGPDTAKLDLGYGTFNLNGSMKYFNRMENSMASVNMKVFNNTNLYMNLYGLVGSRRLMDTLRKMPSDTVRKLVKNATLAQQRGYIDLLGSLGIRIPPRRDTASSRVVLQKWQIDTMLNSDSCGWRWEAEFLPMNADTLRDTDYVFIQSWVHLEGVNNMDSLLIWK
jgi:hypothetical protein